MPSDTEKRNCSKKTRYGSDFEAQESIKRVKRKHGAGTSLRSYRCTVCGSYHITSSSKR